MGLGLVDRPKDHQVYQVQFLLDNMANIPSNNIIPKQQRNKKQAMVHRSILINTEEWRQGRHPISSNIHMDLVQQQATLLQAIQLALRRIIEACHLVPECLVPIHLQIIK